MAGGVNVCMYGRVGWCNFGDGEMIDYEKELGKPEYVAGARQVQIATSV